MTDATDVSYEEKVESFLADLQTQQSALRFMADAGDRFLAFVQTAELPPSESVTGLIVKKYNSFFDADHDDVAWLELSDYIQNKKGKGACHRWLHTYLRGLTHSERGSVAWHEDCTLHCVLMILRYVKFTPETVKIGDKMRKELSKENGLYDSEFNWSKAAARFFATLDDDPFWKSHRADNLFY